MGGVFGGGDDDAEKQEQAELAKEEQDRKDRAKNLETLRLSALKRRQGGSGAQTQNGQQQTLG